MEEKKNEKINKEKNIKRKNNEEYKKDLYKKWTILIIGIILVVVLGVLVFELLKTSMQFLKIDTSYQFIVQGAVIIIAVALDIRKYLAKK